MPATPTILVVEDEILVREFIVEELTSRGMQIIEAGDADQALVALHEHPEIGVLFTDISMPGERNGCDLAREVHTRRPDMALVVTSGKLLPDNCNIPAGGVFVPKPYRADAIARAILRLVPQD